LDLIPIERQYDEYGKAGAAALETKNYKQAAANFVDAWRLFPNRDEYGIAATVAFAMAGQRDRSEAILLMLDRNSSPETARKINQIRTSLEKTKGL
jgi:hypothetical protein